LQTQNKKQRLLYNTKAAATKQNATMTPFLMISPDPSNERSQRLNTMMTPSLMICPDPSNERSLRLNDDDATSTTDVLKKLITEELASFDAEVVEGALYAISCMCYNNGGNPTEATKKNSETLHQVWGAHTHIVLAMGKHSDSMGVQAQGCSALQNLCNQNDAIRQPIVTVGGGVLILAAMKNYPFDSFVQVTGFGALMTLSFKSEHMDALVEQGSVYAVIRVMKQFPEVYPIQHAGCDFIHRVLTTQQEYGDRLVESGGMSVLAAVFENFPDDKFLREWASNVMIFLLEK
jgi:hypothetical protein